MTVNALFYLLWSVMIVNVMSYFLMRYFWLQLVKAIDHIYCTSNKSVSALISPWVLCCKRDIHVKLHYFSLLDEQLGDVLFLVIPRIICPTFFMNIIQDISPVHSSMTCDGSKVCKPVYVLGATDFHVPRLGYEDYILHFWPLHQL